MSEQQRKDFTEMLNQHLGGLNEALGLRFTRAHLEEIEAVVDVGPQHLQPYGIVHGGVYATMIETLCSSGAAINAMADEQSTVGLEHHTSFIRAVREGRLRAVARPLTRGRRSHVWEAEVRDDEDRLVATGRVRMLCLEAGAEAAGETVKLEL